MVNYPLKMSIKNRHKIVYNKSELKQRKKEKEKQLKKSIFLKIVSASPSTILSSPIYPLLVLSSFSFSFPLKFVKSLIFGAMSYMTQGESREGGRECHEETEAVVSKGKFTSGTVKR